MTFTPKQKRVYRVRWMQPMMHSKNVHPKERHFFTKASAHKLADRVTKGDTTHPFSPKAPAVPGTVFVDESELLWFPADADRTDEIPEHPSLNKIDEKEPPIIQGHSISVSKLSIDGDLDLAGHWKPLGHTYKGGVEIKYDTSPF